ncbi:MAG: polysaccharide biosynthesis C-terminal domain-containing protein [Clostridia bacterium]|nr:polysaccharide biosynthesis C-terminal domain-containing protein [Clostridia bacterium]
MKKNIVLHDFIRYSLLSVLGTLGVSLYILADTFFVSAGLGTDGLAALNLAIPLYNVVYGCGLMFGMGGATRYTILRAQGREDDAAPLFTNVVAASALPAFLFVLCGLFLAVPISSLLGAEGHILVMTSTYLRWLLIFAPIYILNGIMLSFVRNDGQPRLTMAAQLMGNLVNIVLDYVFIFPMGMGMFGAILATGFSPLVSIIIMSRHYLGPKCGFRLMKTPISADAVKKMITLGFPSFVTEVSAGVIIILFNTLILMISGSTGVAAYGVVANIALVITGVFSGLGQGVQPLFSRYAGSGEEEKMHATLRYALVSGFAFSAIVYLTVFTLADPITSVFNSEGNALLQDIAASGLRLYFTMMPFCCFNIVISLYFTSSNRPAPAHAISLMRGFMLIVPISVAMALLFGMTGVWLAAPLTEVVCMLYGIFSMKMKRN